MLVILGKVTTFLDNRRFKETIKSLNSGSGKTVHNLIKRGKINDYRHCMIGITYAEAFLSIDQYP